MHFNQCVLTSSHFRLFSNPWSLYICLFIHKFSLSPSLFFIFISRLLLVSTRYPCFCRHSRRNSDLVSRHPQRIFMDRTKSLISRWNCLASLSVSPRLFSTRRILSMIELALYNHLYRIRIYGKWQISLEYWMSEYIAGHFGTQ